MLGLSHGGRREEKEGRRDATIKIRTPQLNVGNKTQKQPTNQKTKRIFLFLVFRRTKNQKITPTANSPPTKKLKTQAVKLRFSFLVCQKTKHKRNKIYHTNSPPTTDKNQNRDLDRFGFLVFRKTNLRHARWTKGRVGL